jgi:hypothetical protein
MFAKGRRCGERVLQESKASKLAVLEASFLGISKVSQLVSRRASLEQDCKTAHILELIKLRLADNPNKKALSSLFNVLEDAPKQESDRRMIQNIHEEKYKLASLPKDQICEVHVSAEAIQQDEGLDNKITTQIVTSALPLLVNSF